MKSPILLAFLLVNSIMTASACECYSHIKSGFYAGLGGSWHTVNETFDQTILTSSLNRALDHYEVSTNRLAPTIQIGYWAPMCGKWLWGLALQWQYLDYETANDRISRGQYLPNASFSSINVFGPEVIREFSSQTRARNKEQLFLYCGKQFKKGQVYVGIGPTLLESANSIYVSSVHKPDGPGDRLISTYATDSKKVWGGAVQVGYNYYVASTCFINASYTFSESERHTFNNSENAALLNGAGAPGSTTVSFKRPISLMDQTIMLGINKVF